MTQTSNAEKRPGEGEDSARWKWCQRLNRRSEENSPRFPLPTHKHTHTQTHRHLCDVSAMMKKEKTTQRCLGFLIFCDCTHHKSRVFVASVWPCTNWARLKQTCFLSQTRTSAEGKSAARFHMLIFGRRVSVP